MSAPSPGTVRAWAVVLVAVTAASATLGVLQLPSPVLFGSLLGGMFYALTMSRPLAIPGHVFNVGQALIGVTIGALVSLPTLQRLETDWPSILGVTVGNLAFSVLAGQLMGLRRDVSRLTGAFSLIAGGASGVTALAAVGYGLIGIQVGLRFTRSSLRSIASLLPLATALIGVVIAGCAAMGAVLAAVTGIPELTAYLATTPGGLYAVLATAAQNGSDVTYVLAVQVIRLFVMLLAAPLLARVLLRRRD